MQDPAPFFTPHLGGPALALFSSDLLETSNSPSDQGLEVKPDLSINLNTGVYFIRHVPGGDRDGRGSVGEGNEGGTPSEGPSEGEKPLGGGPSAAFFRTWLSLKKVKGLRNHDQDALNELFRWA